MPAFTYNDRSTGLFQEIADATELPDSPYVDILNKLDLTVFEQKLITYIEITRAFMAEITSDVEARRLRTAVTKMMAAMSDSPGTYASEVVPPIVGTPNLAALTNTDQMTIWVIGAFNDYFEFNISYDLDALVFGEGPPVEPPTTIDELVTILNNLIEIQAGVGFTSIFQFFNAGNGLIGIRPDNATIARGMNLMIFESGDDGATSLLSKLGMVAGSSDTAIRVRANDAVQRALAPFLTTLRYLPPSSGGDGL